MGHIVITSRLADWSEGVTPLDLDVLDEPSSIAFLLERPADRRISHDDDPATAASIARMLDCLALAVDQSAAYIRHRRCTLRYNRRPQCGSGVVEAVRASRASASAARPAARSDTA